jgi:CRISPR-associated protein Cas1
MIVVIDKSDSHVSCERNSLRVVQGDIKQSIPVRQIEQLLVHGNPHIDLKVWRLLADNAVPTVLLPTQAKHAPVMLGAGLAVQLPLRRRQHRIADSLSASNCCASWFIQRKLDSYKAVLLGEGLSTRLTQTEKADFEGVLSKAKGELAALDSKPECAQFIARLMGIEGSVARHWFALIGRSVAPFWRFSGRNRRPPKDPLNALLSLAYTLLHSQVRQQLIAAGWDVALGFLHQPYPAREALVLDFMELHRSRVDAFAIELLALTETETEAADIERLDAPQCRLNQAAFYFRKDIGCRLSKQARPLFYQAWAEQLRGWNHSPQLACDQASQPSAEQDKALGRLIRNDSAEFRQFLSKQDGADNAILNDEISDDGFDNW